MKTNVTGSDSTKNLVINDNRQVWDAKYVELRRLCILRGLRIRNYTGSSNSYKTTRFDRGRIIVKDSFWSSLKPAYKAQITALNNQIAEIYNFLKEANAGDKPVLVN